MKYEDYVMGICYFLKRLVADNYRLKIEFVKGPPNAEADIIIDEVYLRINIKTSKLLKNYFAQKSYIKILDALAHEFAHVLTDPLYDFAVYDKSPSKKKEIKKVNERQTEQIGRILALLVPENLWNLEERKHADKK